MQSIDVHDLPEPLAQAIESMVQALRRTTPCAGDEQGPTIGERLAPILEEARNLRRDSNAPKFQAEKAKTHNLMIEKFKKQGLKL